MWTFSFSFSAPSTSARSCRWPRASSLSDPQRWLLAGQEHRHGLPARWRMAVWTPSWINKCVALLTVQGTFRMYNSVQVIQVKVGCVTLKWGGPVKIGKMGPSPSGSIQCCVRIQRAVDWWIYHYVIDNCIYLEKKGIYWLTCSSFGCYVIAMRKGNKCRVSKEMVWFEWCSVCIKQIMYSMQYKSR